MTDLTATRDCRGVKYRITIGRGEAPGVRVDGAPIEGSVIPYAPAGEIVDVAVSIWTNRIQHGRHGTGTGT